MRAEDKNNGNELAWKVFLALHATLTGILLFSHKELWSSTNKVNRDVAVIHNRLDTNQCSAIDCSLLRNAVQTVESQVTELSTKSGKEGVVTLLYSKVEENSRRIESLENEQWKEEFRKGQVK